MGTPYDTPEDVERTRIPREGFPEPSLRFMHNHYYA